MNTMPRFLRLAAAAVAVTCLALPGAAGVLANGVGDLYVAVPAGVDETYLLEARTVTRVELAQGPVRLAFTPDGRTLYAGDGARHLYTIDIESISLAETITLDADAAAIAHPRGDALLIATPSSAAIAVLLDGDDAPAATISLPGPADLLAADRRDAHAIAAQRGKPWAAIIESMAGSVREVGVGGEVVAVAIARAEGAAYVATTGPNAVVRIDLATGEVAWSAKLSGPPTGLTPIPDAAVASVGSRLVRASGPGDAERWASLPADATQLATSDEGQFVYAAAAGTVYAVSVAKPDGPPAATMDLDDATPAALAPVPRTSSLAKDLAASGGGSGGSGAGSGEGDGTPGEGSGIDDVPATDTLPGAPLFVVGGRDVTPLLLTAGAVAVVLLFGSRALFARLTGES